MNVESDSMTSGQTIPNRQPDLQFEIVKQLVSYQFGSMWWGRDDLIKSKHADFFLREDRIGHPLLSVMRSELKSREDHVPMLVGSSGKRLRSRIKKRCVRVVGITAEKPDHVCFFGSIIEPGLYSFEEMIDGVVRKQQAFRRAGRPERKGAIVATEPVPWHELRTMRPNPHKPSVNDSERQELEAFCQKYNLC